MFHDASTGRLAALTARQYVPRPYPVWALGTPEHGYAELKKVAWLPAPGLAVAPGFVATGLWFDFETLKTLEVVAEAPVGPERLEQVLRPVATSLSQERGIVGA